VPFRILLEDGILGSGAKVLVNVANADHLCAFAGRRLDDVARSAGTDANDGDLDLVELRGGEVAHVFGSGGAGCCAGSLRGGQRRERGHAGGETTKGFEKITAG
jgi:hypothetical protein